MPLFVRDVLHRSAVWTGIGFGVVAVLNAATLLPGGRLADRLGRRPVIVAGCLVSAAGMLMLALVPGLGGYLAALAVFGLGSGLLDVGPAAMLGDILGGQGGTVVAAYQMAGDIGSVTGPVSAGYLVDVASYGAAFGLAAGVLGLAAVLGLFAPETRWRDRPAAPPPRPGGAAGRTPGPGGRRPVPTRDGVSAGRELGHRPGAGSAAGAGGHGGPQPLLRGRPSQPDPGERRGGQQARIHFPHVRGSADDQRIWPPDDVRVLAVVVDPG